MKKLFTIVLLVACIHGYGQVVSGVLDLRSHDLSSPIEVNGYWEFYWNQLLEPGKFRNPEYIYFPELWNDKVVGEDSLNAFGFATYRVRIFLKDEPEDYAIFVDDFYSATRLYANGELIFSSGIVADNRADYLPEWSTGVVPLEDVSGQLELVLQVANFDHSKGGANDPITFGYQEDLESWVNLLYNLDIGVTTFFIIVAIFFLARFGFVTLDIASFYFSLFCLVYSYRIVGGDFYVLHNYLTNYPWQLAIRLEYLSLFISPFLFAKYLQAIYPRESSTIAINILGVICLLFVLAVIFLQPVLFTRLVEPFFVILGGYFFYGFTIFTSAMLERRTGAVFGFVGVVVVFANFAYLMLEYVSWMPQTPWLAHLGYILFLVFQSIQLFLVSNESYQEFGMDTAE